MSVIFEDDYDNVVLATPVYYGILPGPVLSLISLFQVFRSNQNLYKMKEKKGALLLTAGGTGNTHCATPHINIFFKMIRALGYQEHAVYSLNTDTLPACEDETTEIELCKLAKWLEE